MRKYLSILLAILMLLAPGAAFAQEENPRDMAPEPGNGWLVVDINGETVEFAYAGFTAGMTGNTYNFASDEYTMSIMFDKKLEVGVIMAENSIRQIEIISANSATAGYYFTKKSSDADVQSEVLLEKNEDGLMQGTFRVTVLTADRWVGDLRPGMIAELPLENGEFCFNQ